ncbi:SPFH domain-containing protein [Sulfidibacter corallicola]|uniref:SPFH domain-containing protein n=2 Tax=Sulfidibacter corallicola TaxID=2818388 RepID=A0A8A4TIY3_SULCO|nr:SPFH domain-containing protein [Sulfidibacter corallicola]
MSEALTFSIRSCHMIHEIRLAAWKGIPLLVTNILSMLALVGVLIWGATNEDTLVVVFAVLSMLVAFFCLFGYFMVNPNEAKVLQLFGRYVGTVRDPGLRWANPFYSKKPISLRVRNFDTETIKVNDKSGNPIEIASVVVWKVVDSAEAVFEVDDFENYVHVQSEAALRNLATSYDYDCHGSGGLSLSGSTGEVSEQLQVEVQKRLKKAGVKVLETRISHLAYAPEIAAAMLQRQQASAVVAARSQIVEGAVGMVEMALTRLKRDELVSLNEERQAAMVSNLMVVLCGDRGPQPILNTGGVH